MPIQPRGIARAAALPAGPPITLIELLVGSLWIVFFIIASYGATPLLQYGAVERLAWLAADLVAMMMLLLRPDDMVAQVRRNLVIMTWPALACLSATWSLAPGMSLYHGVQLLLTVLVALCLVLTADLRRILVLLFLALLIAGVLSVLRETSQGFSSDEWTGVFPHKNVLGSMMAVLVMTATSLFLGGWRRYISAPGVVFGLALLAMSRSGTAILALAVVMMIIPLAMTVHWGAIAVGMVTGVALIAAAAGLLALEATRTDFLDLYVYLLDALGKDATLTGRTILWQFAEDAINARPWLGFGYKGWWESSETPAALLRVVVGQELWFFHNTFLDLAVAFGVVGPLALVAGLAVGVYRSVRAFVLNPEPMLLWPIMFVAMSIIYCSVDFVLFANHSFHQFLYVIAAAGIGSSTRRG
jgi:O-antigen ligase